MNIPSTLTDLFTSQQPIYALSPHIDDAIWSTGSFLQALTSNGHDITLISMFTQTIYVYDEIRTPAEATAIRKAEDYNAAHAAGCREVAFLDFPDGILRDRPQNQVLDPTYETPPYLLDLVIRNLDGLIPKQATVLAPAAFGGHVDHLTARRAALKLGRPALLYRDMPYGTREQGNDEALTFLKGGWEDITLPLDQPALETHMDLFEKYQSQTSTAVADEIRSFLATQGIQLYRQKLETE